MGEKNGVWLTSRIVPQELHKPLDKLQVPMRLPRLTAKGARNIIHVLPHLGDAHGMVRMTAPGHRQARSRQGN